MWPFGHTTSGKLRVLQEELAELRAEIKKRVDLLEFEWADWYGKFRLLHARLAKQEKKALQDAPGEPIAGDGDDHQPRAVSYDRPHFPHSRRGF